MKKVIIYCVFAWVLGGGMFIACSNNEQAESEEGTIDRITGKAAREMVNRIRTPINKARSVKDREEDRLNEMDESLKD
jgi:hypothetical protein